MASFFCSPTAGHFLLATSLLSLQNLPRRRCRPDLRACTEFSRAAQKMCVSRVVATPVLNPFSITRRQNVTTSHDRACKGLMTTVRKLNSLLIHYSVNKYLQCKTILPTNALFLLKHKMLQFGFKISLYMAPTCFVPFGPSSRSIRWNLAKVTVSLKSLVKTHR